MNVRSNGNRLLGLGVSLLAILAPTVKAQEGLQLDLQVWNLAVKNLDTGPSPYSYGNSGNVFVGAEGDLETLAGISGASFNLQYVFFPFMYGEGQPAQDHWPGKAGSYFAGAPCTTI